jgi:hypothetical protein
MLPVERTNRVRIKGVSMETTPEDVKDYFNKKLSNDESITSMVYREHLGDYIITFSTINGKIYVFLIRNNLIKINIKN